MCPSENRIDSKKHDIYTKWDSAREKEKMSFAASWMELEGIVGNESPSTKGRALVLNP